ncbi:MAG: IS1 family transposase [Dehalococcoidia bacterium]
MNRLSRDQRCAVVRALVEGNSIRSTCRITGVAKGTVLTLLRDLGRVCAAYQDDTLVNLPATKVQADEIWAFVGSKEKNTTPEQKAEGRGDVWTWVAIDAPTKLCVYWTIGDRSLDTAMWFMEGVASRIQGRVQLTTDGHKAYLTAVQSAFRGEVDYGQLVKLYGSPEDAEKRYSPAVCTGSEKHARIGNPDPAHISTSYVERSNLTIRMSSRRFTRLTNAFSKKAENLAYAVALHWTYYNWARPHMSLKGKTPAMAMGIADHVWGIDEIVALLEASEAQESSQKPN